ncbi:hypothetical protein NIES1031_22615 [Chroogloeocystis siderophila 5.2 s.c.1]|uniref:Uncharacterized protein n=1 Tax=Chroogloeocystis siderophila 5.2 s.c.1 TaxID=247279 RepID=A0A1U7HBD3_9CHRO|nr:hypothetical protein NIES1031_22615 [Chroogloeocystis siderophila 5.2 s.c.1]
MSSKLLLTQEKNSVNINFTSISAIFTQGTRLWESEAMEVEIKVLSNAVQHTSRDASAKRYENLADLLDDELEAALQPKKPSGRYRWRAIPTQR